MEIGSRSSDYYLKGKSKITYIRLYLNDLYKFIATLRRDRQIRIIMLNPSLIPIPLIRDGILMLFSKWMGRNVVLFIRGWDVQFADTLSRSHFLKAVVVFLLNRSDRILVLANKFKRQLCEWGATADRIMITRTMFDGDLVPPRHGRNGKHIQFLFLSRISETKGIREIIRAASHLKQKGYDFHVHIVGFGRDADTVQRIKRLAADLGVTDRLSFTGFVDGNLKYHTYGNADVFLLPSYSEGCPNSVLEAMASGLFVISTGVGALSEVVEDGVNGLIVEPGNWEDLAQKMMWTVAHSERVRAMGKDNIQYAFHFYEADRIVHQIGTICEELLD